MVCNCVEHSLFILFFSTKILGWLHFLTKCTMTGDPSPQMEFIYKKSCIYSYMFKLQPPSKYSPFDAIHLSRRFFHCSKQFLNSLILTPFSASAVFCFTSSPLAKRSPLRTFFIQGNKKKRSLGQDQVNREGVLLFWSKTAEHSVLWWGQVCS